MGGGTKLSRTDLVGVGDSGSAGLGDCASAKTVANKIQMIPHVSFLMPSHRADGLTVCYAQG
jgi:hypothetical protein